MIYQYNREIVNGCYTIDNPERLDISLKQIYLSKEIEDHFTDKKFYINCDLDLCKIIFETELTSAEKDELDVIVNNHKLNV